MPDTNAPLSMLAGGRYGLLLLTRFSV